jgi:hypothetical protein
MTRRRKIALWVIGILLILIVAGRVVLGIYAPDIVRRVATAAVRDKTRMDIQMGEIEVRGLAGLAIADLRLTDTERDGIEVAFIEEVRVDLGGIPWPWRKQIDIAEVRVVRPRVLAVREADGRLNLQRLVQPPADAAEKPAEPSAGPGMQVAVHRIRIEDADLRLLDQTVADPAAVEVTLEGEEQQAGRLVQLTGVNIDLRLTDLAALKHDLDLSFDDSAWGKTTLSGTVQLTPPAVSLKTTDGAITITPQSLATVPVLPAEMMAQMVALQPTANVVIQELSLTDPAAVPHAVVRLTDAGATLPGGAQVRGLDATVTVDPTKISAVVRMTAPVSLAEGVALDDLELTADYAGAAVTATLTKASLLGGRLSGKVRVADVARAAETLDAEVNVEGLSAPMGEAPYAAKVTGLLTARTGHATKASLMEVAFKGKATGGHVQQAPIEMPVDVRATLDTATADAPVAFFAAVGTMQDDIRLEANGTFDPRRRTLVLTRADGTVVFSGDLLARLSNFRPGFIEQTQAQGRLTIASSGATIDLAQPNASRGRLSVASENLRMRIPGTERVEQLAFRADVGSPQDDPSLSLLANVTVSRPESGGNVAAKVTLDRLGSQLAADVTLSRLPVTREVVAELVPRFAPEAAPHLDRLGKLTALLDARARFGYDRDKGDVTQLAATVRISDLNAEAALELDGKPVSLPVANGGAEVTYDLVRKSMQAAAVLDVVGGRLSLSLMDRPGDVVAQVSTADGRPVRLDQLPAAIREKLPVDLAGGDLALAAQTSAKNLPELASGAIAIHAELAKARFLTRPEPGAAVASYNAAAVVDGTVDLGRKQVSGVKLLVTELGDGQGGYLLPPGATLAATVAPFAFGGKPDRADVALQGTPLGQIKTAVTMDWAKQAFTAADLRVDADLGAVPWERMAAVIRSRAGEAMPQGRLRTAADKAAWVSYAAGSGDVTCDVALEVGNLSWMQRPADRPDAPAVRSPALDFQVAVSRASAAQPYHARVWTSDPDYGELDATVGYAPSELSFTARMKETAIQPSLVALLGGVVGRVEQEFHIGGVFSMEGVRGRLVRNAQGQWWPPADLAGVIRVKNLHLDALNGDLPLRNAAAVIDLTSEKIVLKEFTGLLAEGKLAAAGEVALAGEMPFSATVALERLDVRRLATVAKLPPNELVGRLSLRDVAFKGLAAPAAAKTQGAIAIAHTLEGKGHASFGEGHLWQLPLFKVIRSGLFEGVAGFLRGKFDPTSFRTAEADFEFVPMAKVAAPHPAGPDRRSGLIRLPDVRVDSDLIRMVMDGDVYWDDWLDLHVAASVIGEQTAMDRLSGLGDLFGEDVKKATDLLKKLPAGGLPIIGSFYHITGPFQNPQRAVDTRRAWQSLSGSATEFLNRKNKPAEQPDGGAAPPTQSQP